jgi:hypothetical protein
MSPPMHDLDLERLRHLLALPMFLPDARRLAETMLAAELRRRACAGRCGVVGLRASSLEETMHQHASPSSPERASAAAISSRRESARRGLGAEALGPRLDTSNQTDALTEPSTASPGAVDLTLLRDAESGMRVLAGAVIGPCVLIAILYAMAVWL